MIRFGTVTFAADERLLMRDGQPVPLTPKAFDVLAVLVANAGRLVTKEQLFDAVWVGTAVEESNLTYQIFAIRKALGEAPDAEQYIETVPRKGYRFTATISAEEASPVLAPATANGRRRPILAVAALLALAAVAYLGLARDREPRAEPPAVRFQDPVSGRLAESGMFAVSPDGRRLVFAAEGVDGVMRLWLRTMSALEPVALQGTEVFTIVPPMIWSPDSRFIAYDATGTLKKADIDGGTPQTICQLPGTAVGGSWNARGDILLGNASGGLVWCHAGGGAAAVVSAVNAAEQEIHIMPSFLSDGRHFIYLRISRMKPESSGVYLGEIIPGDGGVPRATMASRDSPLITTGFGATFVAGQNGGPAAIVFARDGSLFAQSFDERSRALDGELVRIADHVGSYLDTAFFSASSSTLVYRAPEPDFRLTWFDRRGVELGRVGTPARFAGLALSPNADRVLVPMDAPQGTVNQDLWLFDLVRSAAPQRMTFEPTLERSPVWINDGEFAFGSHGGQSGVYRQLVGGGPHLLFKSGRPELPSGAALDGHLLLYTSIGDAPLGADIWMRTDFGASPRTQPLIEREGAQTQAQLSPDHRWLAYVSNEGGPNEVFVAEFRFDPASGSATAGKSIRLSEGGGFAPRWRADGRELFYLKTDGAVMSIETDSMVQISASATKRLFGVPGVIPEWGVTADGSRFLFAVPVDVQPPFNIVQGWEGTVHVRH